jgi:7-keto-8-aminopelargonate synthetase-like enzyme
MLEADRTQFRRRMLVTDAVFSMDGDTAPLSALAKLAEEHDAALFVDEAHSAGVLGENGAGLATALALPVTISVGTLGKALGTFGAYVTGSRVLIDYLTNRARSFVFTTALPPAICAASSAALEIVNSAEGDRRRARLHQHAQRFAHGARQLRMLGPSSEAPSYIVPLPMPSPELALLATTALLSRGIFVQAIRPPTVPVGTSRLRFTLSAAHTDEDIDRALEALAAIRQELL